MTWRLSPTSRWIVVAVCSALGAAEWVHARRSVSEGFVDMPDGENFVTSGNLIFPARTRSQEAGTLPPRNSAASMNEAERRQAQQKLAPPAIMIQSSLASALDQVRGMRSQLQIAQKSQEAHPASPGQGSSGTLVIAVNRDAIDSFRKQNRELRSNLGSAEHEEAYLKSAVRSFPSIASSDQFIATEASLRDLHVAYQDFAAKTTSQRYLNARAEPNADLDNLEIKLSAAIEKTKILNFDRLDISIG
jgi:hypothetical protein